MVRIRSTDGYLSGTYRVKEAPFARRPHSTIQSDVKYVLCSSGTSLPPSVQVSFCVLVCRVSVECG